MPLLISVLTASFLAACVMTPIVIRIAEAFQLYDEPVGGRRIHTRRTPRLGGISVFLAFLLGLGVVSWLGQGSGALSPSASRLLLGTLASGAILFAAGLVDDIRGIRPHDKLLAQVAAALVAYFSGFQIQQISLGSSIELQLHWLALPVTVAWIVAVTNAFNLIDGLDGLATGLAIVALVMVLTLAFIFGRPDIASVTVALMGALLGFLGYNFNPAKIFLGDSGSLFVGFMLAVLSVYGAGGNSAPVLALIPLSLLALPLLDTSLAIFRRWVRGVPLSSADKRHIHHQMVAIGLTTRRAVLLLYLFASVLAAIGLVAAFAPPPAGRWIAFGGGAVVLLILLLGLKHLDYHEFLIMGTLLIAAPAKLKKVLSDRINARDLADELLQVESLEQLNALLEARAHLFQLSHLEVCRLGSENSMDRVRNRWQTSAWKLDHPVGPYDPQRGDWFVLRIWCLLDDGVRPYGAERVANILGPTIERWLQERDQSAPAEPSITAGSARVVHEPVASRPGALAH